MALSPRPEQNFCRSDLSHDCGTLRSLCPDALPCHSPQERSPGSLAAKHENGEPQDTAAAPRGCGAPRLWAWAVAVIAPTPAHSDALARAELPRRRRSAGLDNGAYQDPAAFLRQMRQIRGRLLRNPGVATTSQATCKWMGRAVPSRCAPTSKTLPLFVTVKPSRTQAAVLAITLSGLTVTISITTSRTSNQREIMRDQHVESKAGFSFSFALPVSSTVNISSFVCEFRSSYRSSGK